MSKYFSELQKRGVKNMGGYEKVTKNREPFLIVNVFGLIFQVLAGISMWKRLVEVFSC